MSELEWIDIFSGNLRSIMEEVGVTQKELAKDSGLSKSMISDFVNGKRMPGVKSLVSIIHAFPELDDDDLFNSLVYFGDRLV